MIRRRKSQNSKLHQRLLRYRAILPVLCRDPDIEQAIEVCRIAADEMLVVAAQQDAGLSPTDRRHLAAIAQAVLARIASEPAMGAESLTEPTDADPG